MGNKNLKGKGKNSFINAAQNLDREAVLVSPKSVQVGDIINFNYSGFGNYTAVVTFTPIRGGPLWTARTTKNLLLFAYSVNPADKKISFGKLEELTREVQPDTKTPVLTHIHNRLLYKNKEKQHEGQHYQKTDKRILKRKDIEPPEAIETLSEKLGIDNFRTFIVNKIGRCMKIRKRIER